MAATPGRKFSNYTPFSVFKGHYRANYAHFLNFLQPGHGIMLILRDFATIKMSVTIARHFSTVLATNTF